MPEPMRDFGEILSSVVWGHWLDNMPTNHLDAPSVFLTRLPWGPMEQFPLLSKSRVDPEAQPDA